MNLNKVCSLLLIVVSFSFKAQFIDWENEIEVASNVYGNVRPRLVLNNMDQPVVLFGKSSMGLFVSRLENNLFSTPIKINTDDSEPYITNWTSADITSMGDTIALVYKVNPLDQGKVYLHFSFDGGAAFSDTIPVVTSQSGVSWLPVVSMDSSGNTLVASMVHDAVWSNPRFALRRTNDFGITFESELDLTSSIPEEACDCCPSEFISRGSNHVLLYRNNNQNIRDIYAVRSSNNADAFDQWANAEELNWAVNSCPSTAPHGVLLNDKMISCAASRSSGKFRVYLSEFDLDSIFQRTLTDSIVPPENFNGSQNYPRISASNDTVVLVWQESNPSNYDIFLSYSLNGLTEELLSNKIQVNDDPAGAQLNPDVIVKNGFVHIVYQDNNGGVVKYRKGKFSSLGLNSTQNIRLNLYPNPTDNLLCVDVKEPLPQSIYNIFDVNGNKVKTGKIEMSKQCLSVEALLPGNYIFQVDKTRISFTKK